MQNTLRARLIGASRLAQGRPLSSTAVFAAPTLSWANRGRSYYPASPQQTTSTAATSVQPTSLRSSTKEQNMLKNLFDLRENDHFLLSAFPFCGESTGWGGPTGRRSLIFSCWKEWKMALLVLWFHQHLCTCARNEGIRWESCCRRRAAQSRVRFAWRQACHRPLSLAYHSSNCSTLAALFLQLSAAMMNYRLNTSPLPQHPWLFLSFCAVFFQTSTLEIQLVLRPSE